MKQSQSTTVASSVKNACPLRRSGRINWDEYQNWAQCCPFKSTTPTEIAQRIDRRLHEFSCGDCIVHGEKDLGSDGLFSISEPEKVFIDHDALVYFVWAWRAFVTLKTGGTPMYWDTYCARNGWSGQARPQVIKWVEAVQYHVEPLNKKIVRILHENKMIIAGVCVGLAIGALIGGLVVAARNSKKTTMLSP
jgi:hypothetical protein